MLVVASWPNMLKTVMSSQRRDVFAFVRPSVR